jgi:hypothetical protein
MRPATVVLLGVATTAPFSFFCARRDGNIKFAGRHSRARRYFRLVQSHGSVLLASGFRRGTIGGRDCGVDPVPTSA